MSTRITDEELEGIFSQSDKSAPAKEGAIVGKPAPDFTLSDHNALPVKLSEVFKAGPVIIALCPRELSQSPASELIDYRDDFDSIKKFGIQFFALGSQPSEAHKKRVESEALSFRVLSDPDNKIARTYYGSGAFWLLEQGSRALFIIDNKGTLIHRSIDPLTLVRSHADHLLGILKNLKSQGKI